MTRFASFSLALALCVGSLAEDPTKAASSSLAPEFRLESTDGGMISLSDFKGKFVVLEWWNSQCPFVRSLYTSGAMQQMQSTVAQDGNVWLTISSSGKGRQGYVTAETGQEQRASSGMKSRALLLDTAGTAMKDFKATVTPEVVLINPDGHIIYRGAISSVSNISSKAGNRGEPYLMTAYRLATSGKAVGLACATPKGCPIRR